MLAICRANEATMADPASAVIISSDVEASRSLASHGVPVVAVAQERSLELLASQSIRRLFRGPEIWARDFAGWLAALPLPARSALLPGSDDAAWWLAAHKLGETAPFHAIRDLLIKYRLYERSMEAGIAAPGTWLAEPGMSLDCVTFPAVVKPQMRVGLKHWTRGRIARNKNELAVVLDEFQSRVSHHDTVLRADPVLACPIVQEYVVRPRRAVYHLVGYLSRAGEYVVAAHRKVLQYPRRFGSGICFESEDVDAELAAGLLRLLSNAGYHGIFEAEYVECGRRRLLIDLNPRTYNGLSLEVRRGYDLPWYLYLDAIGETEPLSRELAAARERTPPHFAWRDGTRFWMMLVGQSLSGGMGGRDVAEWLRWTRSHRGHLLDPHFNRQDPWAGVADVVDQAVTLFRDPRKLLGTYVKRGLDR